MTDKQVIKEASILATSDITDFLTLEKTEKTLELKIKPSEKWPEHKRRAIKSVKQTKHGFELTLHGKDVQLTNLFKHFKLFEEYSEEKPVSNFIEALKGQIKEVWEDE